MLSDSLILEITFLLLHYQKGGTFRTINWLFSEIKRTVDKNGTFIKKILRSFTDQKKIFMEFFVF